MRGKAVILVLSLAAIGLAATLPAYAEDAKPVPKPATATASSPVNANPSPNDGVTVPNANDRPAAEPVRAGDNWAQRKNEFWAKLSDAQAKLKALSSEADAVQAKIDALLKGTIPSTQPLTRADCETAGFAWNDGNVCDWQAEDPKDVEPTPEIAAAIPSGQPLTRADCNKAGMVWSDRANVCGFGPNETMTRQSSISSKVALKPHGTAKPTMKIKHFHAKRKNTSRRPTAIGESDGTPPFW
jgi:hypothetical protein